MHIIDYVIFVINMVAMLGIGLYFFNKNKTAEDFYVSGRKLSNWHFGLPVVARSGNIITDSTAQFSKKELTPKKELRLSQNITLLLGIFAILLASQMQNVLELMLYSYAFMVSGLFIPVLAALFWKKSHLKAAFWSMLFGGAATLLLIIT